jgi:L-alanine-DL-glutamate epimerase-like enolase superfamily enzyme
VKLSYYPYQLKLKHPFKLAYGTRTVTDIVLVELQHEGHTGYGEASLPPYLVEGIESVTAFLDKIETSRLDPFRFRETVLYLDALDSGNNAAKAAVDIALHDLLGKMEDRSLADLMSIPASRPTPSSFTIGMSTRTELESKLKDASDYPIIKLKLGGDDDKELVKSYLEQSTKPYYVDVNQGWEDGKYALEMAAWLTENGCLLIEQPMPTGMIEETSSLSEGSSIPIIADESVRRLEDLAALKGVFNGVNIKLMKCAGMFEAVRMIEEARKMKFQVLIGCMAESSCAVTAAANLAPLADWADLDGPALISNDPFRGMRMENGNMILPSGPGLGLEKVVFK